MIRVDVLLAVADKKALLFAGIALVFHMLEPADVFDLIQTNSGWNPRPLIESVPPLPM